MSDNYKINMIYKGKEITRTITKHWSNTLEFTLKALYPEAQIISIERLCNSL